MFVVYCLSKYMFDKFYKCLFILLTVFIILFLIKLKLNLKFLSPFVLVFNFINIKEGQAVFNLITFQSPATPFMEGVIDFNHRLMILLCFIGVFVGWLLLRTIELYTHRQSSSITLRQEVTIWCFESILSLFGFELDVNDVSLSKSNNVVTPKGFKNITHCTWLEIIWTILPAFSLFVIAFPSFCLLYAMDDKVDPSITLKVIGHQWYWSYEYSDYVNDLAKLKSESVVKLKGIKFDSYLIPEEDLSVPKKNKKNKVGKILRLLEVDNRVIVPTFTHIRVLITGADVLHSWAIPSLGIKVDSCPGRLNQIFIFLKREGVFYGQCSEICGVNHGFMPIVIEAVSLEKYAFWVSQKLKKL